MRYTITANGSLLYDSMSMSQLITNPKCKRERGKAGTVSFSMHPDHSLYNSLERLKTEIVCQEDGVEIFRGRVYEIETDIWKQRNVTCEGDLSYLVDSLQPPDRVEKTTEETVTSEVAHNPWGDGEKTSSKTYTYTEQGGTKETIYNHLRRQIETNHNAQVDAWKRFTLGNVTIDEKDTEIEFDASNYRETMSAIEQDVIDYYGGYLQTRRVGNTTYIDYIKEDSGAVANQVINFGQNMIEMSETLSSDDIFTVLVPTGDNDLTIYEVNNNRIELENSSGIAKYGRIYKTQSFSGIDDANKLKTLGQSYLNKNSKLDPVKFSITAIDLKNLGVNVTPLAVGMKVRILAPRHNIDRTLEILSIEISMDAPESTQYEIGDPDTTLSERYKKDSDKNANSAADANSTGRGAGSGAGQVFKLLKESGKELMFLGDELTFTQDKVTINANLIDINAKEIKFHDQRIKYFEDAGVTIYNLKQSIADLDVVNTTQLSAGSAGFVCYGPASFHGTFTFQSNSWTTKTITVVKNCSVHDSLYVGTSGRYYLTGAWLGGSVWLDKEIESITYLGH